MATVELPPNKSHAKANISLLAEVTYCNFNLALNKGLNEVKPHWIGISL